MPTSGQRSAIKRYALVAAAILAAVLAYDRVHARWTGAAGKPGYQDAFPRHARAVDKALKGSRAAWVPFEAREHPGAPTALWGATRRPYPTGAWWTNLVVGGPNSKEDGVGAAEATPYVVSVLPRKGVGIGYSPPVVAPANDSIGVAVAPDVYVSFSDGFDSHAVAAWDDLTMTMRLTREATKKAPAATLDALFARGSPYVTFRSAGATPAFTSDAEIKDVYAVGAGNETASKSCSAYPSCVAADMHGACCPQPSGVTHPCCAGHLGTQGPAEVFALELNTGGRWRLYFSEPVSVRWDSQGAAVAGPFAGVLRVAFVPPDASAKHEGRNAALLDAHAETYTTAGEVRASVDRARDPNVGVVEFQWRLGYMGSSIIRDEPQPALLMLALPHHVDSFLVDESIGFLEEGVLAFRGGLKGPTRGILGATWRLREPLTTLQFTAGRPVADPEYADAIRAQLRSDVARPAGETDGDAAWIAFDDWFGNAYWNGKEAARLAQLALVAAEVGDAASEASALGQMRAILELWLSGANRDPLVYDATYGGLCTRRGLYDHDADFGNGYYNDHHFHYGYMLYAAAVAVKNDAGFMSEYREALFALLYDVASPGPATRASLETVGIDRAAFPRARHKDFYAGHSWASGIFFMGQGKAQESSSEAVNAYYGAYLLAAALGDVELSDWCRILLATELRAAKRYYHMPAGGDVYPAAFADRNKVVGVLGALNTGSQTWFGPSVAYAHGIQILPITPITEELLDPPEFVAEDLAFLDQHLEEDVDDAWKAFLVCERAVLDPAKAWKELMALQTVDAGASKTAMLYWIATRPAPDEVTKDLLKRAAAADLASHPGPRPNHPHPHAKSPPRDVP